MKINTLRISNFKLLKDFKIDLEENLSLVIGKNNTGKTSMLKVLNRFLRDNKPFTFDEFNIDFKSEVRSFVESKLVDVDVYSKNPLSISLDILIEYFKGDNLSNLRDIIMTLDPDNNFVYMRYQYYLSHENLILLKEKYSIFKNKEIEKKSKNQDYVPREIDSFLKSHQDKFFKTRILSLLFNPTTGEVDEENFIDLTKENISTKNVLAFRAISARRNVTNKESKSLSLQTSKIYEKAEKTDVQNKAVEDFEDHLVSSDKKLTKIYTDLFQEVIEKVKKFGGVKDGDSQISIESTLKDQNIMEGNTTVMYDHNGTTLPEYNNGLGYMNLLSMIFEIEILINDLKRTKNEKPADINILFIEEPEAHTHPQMQYVFIKNIKSIINEGIKREDGIKRPLQTILTTHSSHIVSESDFDDIKYLLKREGENRVQSRNLSSLKKDYGLNTDQYQFLSQYLTLNRAEVFFADKIIMIEGDTERILMPTFLRKIDIEEQNKHKAAGTKDEYLPLVSQNISIIEVGAHSQIFDKFIEFAGIKSLIITDIDTFKIIKDKKEKCPVAEGEGFSNSSINHYFDKPKLEKLLKNKFSEKVFAKEVEVESGKKGWKENVNGDLAIVYQTADPKMTGRSFEESFLILNKKFVADKRATFNGIKNADYFDEGKTAFELADECIKKKTHFALDIIYHSNKDYSNWEIPSYIKEGLLWLKKK